jgi:phosphoribosylaminoimidazole-succinocarboxamide synthase
MSIVLETNLAGVRLFKKGKVRDVYLIRDKLLIISTDRISAFDVILNDAIPDKGKILTGLSCFWFNYTKDIIQNHLITSDVSLYPEPLKQYADELSSRSMLVKKTRLLPIECIVRGYLSGSGWKEYLQTGMTSGIKLPIGLKESEKLTEPLFTPSTKAEAGHDQNISFKQMTDIIGSAVAQKIKDVCLNIFIKASQYAESKGIIIADTKMEFGMMDNEVILIDELLTPDSSRFWDAQEYRPGISPPSFDKQFIRDYLISINWERKPPAPKLPEEVINKTRDKYLLAYQKITGNKL